MDLQLLKIRTYDKVLKEIKIWDFKDIWESQLMPDISEYKIMRFTGLSDKFGKDIYEGDILRANQKLYEIPSPLTVKVIYNNEFARFEPVQYWKSKNQWFALSDGFKCDYDFEIIGNIYENPELL